MSNEILRVDDDYYCVWSSNVDGPVMWGTRQQVTEFLTADAHEEAKREAERVIERIPSRFERADIKGTSSYVEGFTGRIFEQKGLVLPGTLKAFLESYRADEDGEGGEFDESLLVPFDDEDDDG